MRSRIKRVLKFTGLCILSVLVLVAVGMVVMDIIWGRQVEAELAKIRAKGEPVSVQDLIGPKIPDSENGATIYIEIGKRLSTDEARKDMDTLSDFTSRQTREKNPELWDKSRAIVRKYADVMTQVETAATKPMCRYPAGWWKHGTDDTPIRYYSQFRTLARLLHADALLSAKDGRMDECCRSIGLGVELANGLSDERTFISYLVSIVALGIAHDGLQDSLKYGRFDEYQCRQLCDTLSKLDLVQGHRKVLLTERVSLLYDIPRVGGKRIIEMTRLRGWSSMADDLAGRNRRPTDHVLGLAYDLAGRNGDMLVWLRFMDKQIAGLRLDYKQASAEGLMDDEPWLPFYAVMSNMMAGVQTRGHVSRFRGMSWVAGDQVLLSLIAYRDRFGAYPSDLSELRAKLGWKIPEDPFGGKEFIYRRKGDGFILYSIGRNMKDDGGMESPRSDPDKNDMVWRMER